MRKTRVCLKGGDNIDWALDEDLSLTKQSLETIVEFSNLESSEVVHLVGWEGLKTIPPALLLGKKVICHVPGEPFRYYALPGYSQITQPVDIWVSQTHQAQQQLSNLGVVNHFIPYAVDKNIFYRLAADHENKRAIREEWNIPSDAYLIGSFQRDTEGADLISPKLVKGPDIFFEIARALWDRGNKIHILLAGPRRFWLRKRLKDYGIPCTFIGEILIGDDIQNNILPRTQLNILYNLIDLYLVSSRSEGGPRAILEACAAQCKILSTPVGLAMDILEPDSIYHDPAVAINRIEKDIHENILQKNIKLHTKRIDEEHLPERNVQLFENLYSNLENITPVNKTNQIKNEPTLQKVKKRFAFAFLRRFKPNQTSIKVSLWHKFVSPPFGGGNQFMLALRHALLLRGVQVIENKIEHDVNAYILNAIRFDIDLLRKKKSEVYQKIIHRIDGPIILARGKDAHLDDLCFELNNELAYSTILQSSWTFQRSIELGYKPVNPVVILNTVNPNIFHNKNRVRFSKNRKIRLISSSWSNNPRKGGAVYKWLDQNLDWDRWEYTFVGNVSENFEHIRCVPPVPSEELANILRQCDIYITASKNESCSNGLIEGLACGLPALYFNDGGHPELVGYGGLPFNDVEETLSQLDKLVADYEIYQNLIVVPTMDGVVEKYLSLIKDVSRGDGV